RSGDARELVVVEREAEMLRESLAIVVDPSKDTACHAAVAVADRQAAVEEGCSAARARTSNQQIVVERAAETGGREPVGHLEVDRPRSRRAKAIKAVPYITKPRLQHELGTVRHQPKGLVR